MRPFVAAVSADQAIDLQVTNGPAAITVGLRPDHPEYWIDFTDRPKRMMGDPADDVHARDLIELLEKTDDDLGLAVDRGAGILFSPVSYCYLDRPYADQPTDEQRELWDRLGLRKAFSPVTIEDAFDFDLILRWQTSHPARSPALRQPSGARRSPAKLICSSCCCRDWPASPNVPGHRPARPGQTSDRD